MQVDGLKRVEHAQYTFYCVEFFSDLLVATV
jgi:hypothetical protein